MFRKKLIEKVFTENGFVTFYPEELSLEKQIAIFKQAKEIACVNGTIPLNVVWAIDNRALELIVINKTSIIHKNILWASKISGIQPVYVDAWYEPLKNVPFNLGMGPYWLKITEEIRKFWDDKGFKYNLDDVKEDSKKIYYKYLNIAMKNWLILKKEKLIKYLPFKRKIKKALQKAKMIFKHIG